MATLVVGGTTNAPTVPPFRIITPPIRRGPVMRTAALGARTTSIARIATGTAFDTCVASLVRFESSSIDRKPAAASCTPMALPLI